MKDSGKLRALAANGDGQGNPAAFVQFPTVLRTNEGQQYEVDQLVWTGKFYRVAGKINPIITNVTASTTSTQNITENINKENSKMNFNSVFEELNKLYEEAPKAVAKTTDKLCSVVFDGEQQIFTGTRKECEDWIKTKGGSTADRMSIKDSATIMTREACDKNLKEAANIDLSKYRIALADYEDDDGEECEDIEYLLKPGQTKGDLVVHLSHDAGFMYIYVHDERLATAEEVKQMSHITFDTKAGEDYTNYGSVDKEDWLEEGCTKEALVEAADDEIEIVDEEPAEDVPVEETEEAPAEEDVNTVEEFLKSIGEYDGDLKLEFKPIVIDGKEYSINNILWSDEEEGKLVAEFIVDMPEEEPAVEEEQVEEEPVEDEPVDEE